MNYPDNLKKVFLELWKKLKIYHPMLQKKQAILSYSGGKDSTFLLHFYLFLFQNSWIPKIKIYHLDHSIRNNSKQEKEIENYIKNNFPFLSCFNKKSIPKLSKKLKMSLEQTGRIFRKKDLNQIMDSNSYIVTAHHPLDYIESFFIHFIRGTGINGLKTLGVFENHFFRPLMFLEQKNWKVFFQWKDLVLFEDETNHNEAFLRNRIRKNIIPLFLKEGLNIDKTYKNFHNEAFFPFKTFSKQKIEKVQLWTEYFHFYSLEDLKKILDINLKVMNLYPLNSHSLQTLQNKIEQGTAFTLWTKQVIFWKSTKPMLFVLSKNALFFQKPRMIENQVFWNRNKKKVRENYQIGSYQNFKIFQGNCHKSISEILREKEIPVPVRTNIPILTEKNKVKAILLSMWDEKKSDILCDDLEK